MKQTLALVSFLARPKSVFLCSENQTETLATQATASVSGVSVGKGREEKREAKRRDSILFSPLTPTKRLIFRYFLE